MPRTQKYVVDLSADERAELEAMLAREDADEGSDVESVTTFDRDGGTPFDAPRLEVDVPDACVNGEDLTVEVRTSELNEFDGMTLHYRHTNQAEGAFVTTEMTRTDGGYSAVIPGDYVDPEWDLLVYVGTSDEAGNAVLCPGLYHPSHPEPYCIVETS
jgi:hypothetical protein